MPPFTWFPSRIVSAHTTIILQEKEWFILDKMHEHSAQKDEEGLATSRSPSHASIRLKCVSQGVTAHMRIYMQIPLVGTEFVSADERAQQATTYEPVELRALRDMTNMGSLNTPQLLDSSFQTQDSNGLVPGGFLIFLVWQIVPGLRLGDNLGAEAFWALEQKERSDIQAAFPYEYKKLISMGYLPRFAGPKSLVWDSASKQLYFVGFRDCHEDREKFKWTPALFAAFHLAKAPRKCNFGSPRWDGNMEGWRW